MASALAACVGSGPPGSEPGVPASATCAPAGHVLPLTPGDARLTPYNLALAPDLDGGGRGDVVMPWSDGEGGGLAIVRGESDGTTPDRVLTPLFAASIDAVGVAGDLDADGLPELALGEQVAADGEPTGPYYVAVRWWSVARSVELGRFLTFDDEGGGAWGLPPYPLPDLDGDGVPEVAAGAVHTVRVFSGVRVAGVLEEADAALILTDLALANGLSSVRGLPDHDRDGGGDLLVLGPTGLHLLDAATFRAGGTVAPDTLPVLAAAPDSWDAPLDALLLDADGDGAPELYASWFDRLVGWDGADVLAVRRGERGPLSVDDARLTVEAGSTSSRGAYLGVHLATYSDATCLPALAVSAHFEGTVHLLDNATLVEGGAVDLAALDGHTMDGWGGYGLGGGADFDGDGGFDLVVGRPADDTYDVAIELLLGP